MQVIRNDEDWAEIEATEGEAEIHFNLEMPIHHCSYQDLPAELKAEADESDVYVRGPVYVGNEAMLDRHKELVDGQAIIDSWPSYEKNPVILFNHRKDYGTIGKMLEVKMGDWPGIDFPVPIGYAMIDGGEEKIARKIRKGLLRAFSIGFIAKAGVKECPGDDKENCYIIFTEIDWIETSVVDIPASPGAWFNVSKALVTKSWRVEKEEIETDVFTTLEEAEARAAELGCEGIHTHELDNGDTVFMPCSSHDDYTAITGEELETPEAAGYEDDKKTADPEPKGDIEEQLTELGRGFAASVMELWGNSNKNEEKEETACDCQGTCSTKEAGEETTALNSPVDKSDDIPNREASKMTAEEITEETPTETEAVSPTHELEAPSLPKPVEVLVSVVEELGSIKTALATLESKFALSESIDELNATIEAKDAEIAELKAAEIEATKQAEFDAAVEAKIAEMGLTAPSETPTPAPERKSAPVEETKAAPTVVDLDPHIKTSPGVHGLQGWLEYQLAARGRQA